MVVMCLVGEFRFGFDLVVDEVEQAMMPLNSPAASR